MADNIVKFPKEKLRSLSTIQSQEEMIEQIKDYKTSFATDLTDILSTYIFGEMARCGIDFEEDISHLLPSMILVSESIQSLQLAAAGIHHPLQDFASEAFSDNVEKEPTS